MPIQRARSIDSLYDDVADYDLVLAPDAPLASAINRRLDVPHFGTFATTPRRLAVGRRERAEDRTAFLELVERTDHDWKSLSYAVGNVLQCWEHQGRVDAILGYDRYADEVTRDVVEELAALRTTSSQLSQSAIEADNVAVVGEDQLTTLESSVLPDEYDSVPLFADEPFEYPPFNVFDSSADVVDAILDTVDADTAGEVAVVLNRGSRYSSLIEAALEAADVPYYGGRGFAEQPHHRSFLSLCRIAFRGMETTVAEVKPILTQLGTPIDVDHDDKRLHAVDLPETEWITEVCSSFRSMTFGEALGAYEGRSGAGLNSFRDELARLGLDDAVVDEDRLDALTYYLRSYDVPVDRENEGVLLADAKSSGYVDRPVVFHVGLDEDWTHAAPRRPWVDTEARFERNLRQFQLLLQSGVEQYYLVRDTAGGQPVTPCLYFDELLDQAYDRFSDLDAVSHTRTVEDAGDGFETEPVDVAPQTEEITSNSRLKTFVNCPRDYYFDQLVDGPDRDYFTEGTLFHDFAEFYVDHSDVVDDGVIEEVVDVVVDETMPLFSETAEPLRRRKYRIGLETIVEYLDDQRPFSGDFLTPTSGWESNVFAEHFDRPVESPLTERWFEDANLGIRGMIDLVDDPAHLVDFKSGRKKSRRTVIRNAAIDPPGDTPDFQAALYLAYFRTVRPEEPLEFTFFHFLETLDDVVTGDHDLEETLTTISYYPWTFDDHVGSRAAFGTLLDGYTDCVETFEDLGFDAYSEIVGSLSFPETTDGEALRASTFAAQFTAAVDDRTTDDVDAEKGADQAVRLLNGVRKKAFFREDLDAIEGFVQERLAELNRYRSGEERFPIEGPGGEPNYRRVDHRDMILEGAGDE